MKNVEELPLPAMIVELSVADGPVGVRVDRVRDAEIDLSLPEQSPPGVRPRIGDRVILRWPAGQRGRYTASCLVLPPPDDERITVLVRGTPEIVQNRKYFRGGGGERILLDQPADLTEPLHFTGWVQDLSERGARAHFADARVREGDPLFARIELDGRTVEVPGTALRVRALPDDVGAYLMRVEVVVLYTPEETEARLLRRYVFAQQLLGRPRP